MKKPNKLEEAKIQAEIERIRSVTQLNLIKTAKLQSQIIIRQDAKDIVNQALATVSEQLDNLPTRLAKELSGQDLTSLEIKEIVSQHIRAIKSRMITDLEELITTDD